MQYLQGKWNGVIVVSRQKVSQNSFHSRLLLHLAVCRSQWVSIKHIWNRDNLSLHHKSQILYTCHREARERTQDHNWTIPSELLVVSCSDSVLAPVMCSDTTSGDVGSWRWVEPVELWLDKVVKKRSSESTRTEESILHGCQKRYCWLPGQATTSVYFQEVFA